MVKMALKEWRHWLEGTAHRFTVYIDHTNFKYLQFAKKKLFFTCFHFTIAYRPGSKKMKADALSRQHSELESKIQPERILTLQCFINADAWDFDK